MSLCTFFGHHDCPAEVKPKLREVLIDLIENHSVNVFYVGNKGAFDRMVRSVLRELAQEYIHIYYAVVLEHMPGKKNGDYPEDYSDTMLPEGIEEVPPVSRFGGGGSRDKKKQTVIEKLKAFFEKYFGLIQS